MATSRPILVTGGAGFIGSHLVDRLLAEGNSVVVIDDVSTGRLENLARATPDSRLRVLRTKVSACKELEDLARSASWIVHLAAAVGVELVVRSPVQTIETNLHETEAILDAASRAGTPLLLASTSEVYGRSSKTRFSESDDLIIGPPSIGRWSYACSKLMDEFLALAHARERGLPVMIVRLFNIAGPRQTGRFGMVLPRFVEAAMHGQALRVFGDGRQTRCFCHVADAVEALVRLWKTPSAYGEIINVGGDQMVSIHELAQLVATTLGSSSSIELIPYSHAYAGGFEDMMHRQPDLSKLIQFTGFRPERPLSSIIQEIAAELREKPVQSSPIIN
jgi:UDP-glucose 4-epimerase